jgi:hypothetical protein
MEFIMSISCDKTPPAITLVGSNAAQLIYDPSGAYTDGEREFERLMGRSADVWTGIVQVDRGDKNMPVEISATLHSVSASPLASQNMPTTAGTYIIVYAAAKPECDGVVPTAMVQRYLNIAERIATDTVPPVIMLNGPATIDIQVGTDYVDMGATAHDGRGNPITAVLVSNNVNVNAVGIYQVGYEVCKTLTSSDGHTPVACVYEARTVRVIEMPITTTTASLHCP